MCNVYRQPHGPVFLLSGMYEFEYYEIIFCIKLWSAISVLFSSDIHIYYIHILCIQVYYSMWCVCVFVHGCVSILEFLEKSRISIGWFPHLLALSFIPSQLIPKARICFPVH